MLALHIELLTDRFAATAYNNREVSEWPPELARVFSALTAALHDDEPPQAEQASALDALAQLGAPVLVASDAHARRVLKNFVPVNDVAITKDSYAKKEAVALAAASDVVDAERALAAAVKVSDLNRAEKAVQKAIVKRNKAHGSFVDAVRDAAVRGPGTPEAAIKVLPWGRTKKERYFPAVLPHHGRVSYLWPDHAVGADTLAALRALAARVANVGHSSSFVRVSVDEQAPPPNELLHTWAPDAQGERVYRVPLSDQRVQLESAFAQHKGDSPGRVMPFQAQRYRLAGADSHEAHTARTGGRWVSYLFDDRNPPPAFAVVGIAQVVRAALLAHATEPIAPMLSGHDGAELLHAEHLTILPLPFVGHEHADGDLRGFAVVLPAGAPEPVDTELLRALHRWEGDERVVELRLRYGKLLRAQRLIDPDDGLRTTHPDRWSAAATSWVTVTPIALDGECPPFDHPAAAMRRKAYKIAEKLIRRAVTRAVLTASGEPLDADSVGVALAFDPPVVGAASLRDVPPFQRGGHARPRRLVHALIELPEPCRGPLVLGAGRHLGLGLCLPLPLSGAHR